jgi:hypothetical protein
VECDHIPVLTKKCLVDFVEESEPTKKPLLLEVEGVPEKGHKNAAEENGQIRVEDERVPGTTGGGLEEEEEVHGDGDGLDAEEAECCPVLSVECEDQVQDCVENECVVLAEHVLEEIQYAGKYRWGLLVIHLHVE